MKPETSSAPLVECRSLVKAYRLRGLSAGRGSPYFPAVAGISLRISVGESLALVGESGCGKSTTGRLLLALERPTSGSVHFQGCELAGLGQTSLRRLRRHMQMIFQDPYCSLNPRFTVGAALSEPLRIHEGLSGKRLEARVANLLETVGLSPEHARGYPHEFSGGQRQRIAIARAVAVNPDFVVADEPVSALDISVQGQILKLLLELKKQLGMAMLFISHDLAVVRQISQRVAVMYRGRIMELAPTEELFTRPLHPYTRLLLDSVLRPVPPGKDKEAPRQAGRPAAPGISGACPFSGRCPKELARCLQQVPEPREVAPGHWVACILAMDNAG